MARPPVEPARRLLALLAGIALAMVPLGWVRYTSAGFDVRSHVGPDRVNREYRLRWPGDGTIGIFHERVREPIFEPLDRFDVALRLLWPPERRAPRSAWNRAGFWNLRVERLRGSASVHTRWIAVPSWLPAGVLALAWILSRRRNERCGRCAQAGAPPPREERT